MTAAAPIQERVDQIALDLAPDVVRIRCQVGQDWSGHPDIYFRVVLSDDASRPERLAAVTETVSARLFDELDLSMSDRIPYFRFRSWSEQAKLGERAWD